MSFGTGATGGTDVTIDSSGNLLVGKTSSAFGTAGVQASVSNGLWSTRSSLPPLALNRLSSDGSIVDFYKDGSPVGNIGVVNGDRMYFATADGLGLQFDKDNNRIVPCDAAGAYNSNVELGDSGLEFTNLFLTGGIQFDSRSNKLDDYEEGTWTAELKGSTGSATTPVTRTGTYTKVGNLVHVQVGFVNVNTTGASGSIQVTGLPFTNTSANSSTVTLGQYTKLAHSADSNPIGYINPSANLIQMSQFNDSAVGANWFITATTGVYFYVSATYTI
jgi:hypothetical protein